MCKLTGTKYCKETKYYKQCKYLHCDIDGVYCVLSSFIGMYTEECPKRKSAIIEDKWKEEFDISPTGER